MNIFVIDSDWKRRALIAFSLSKEGINAVPLDPADPIDISPCEPQLFLLNDQDETRELLRAIPRQSRAICYAAEVQLRDVVSAMHAGAQDYVAWPGDLALLVEAIRRFQIRSNGDTVATAANGDRGWHTESGQPVRNAKQISPGPRSAVVVDLPTFAERGGVNAPAPSRRPRTNDLSARELEVLQLASHGLSSQSIAERLGIRRKTVEAHRNNILIKTRSNNMAEAVRWGIMGRII